MIRASRRWRHDTQHNGIQHNDTQHNSKLNATFSMTTLSTKQRIDVLTVTYAQGHLQAIFAECRYAECHYGECRSAVRGSSET